MQKSIGLVGRKRKGSVRTVLEKIEMQICDAFSFPSLSEELVFLQEFSKFFLRARATSNVHDSRPKKFFDLAKACRTFVP